jgi:hypothetical protein
VEGTVIVQPGVAEVMFTTTLCGGAGGTERHVLVLRCSQGAHVELLEEVHGDGGNVMESGGQGRAERGEHVVVLTLPLVNLKRQLHEVLGLMGGQRVIHELEDAPL